MKQGALAAALAMAIVGAALLYLYKQRFEAEVSGGPKTQILIAANDIAPGEVLTLDNVKLFGIPAAYMDTRHIRANQMDSFMGVRVRTKLNSGEAVLSNDLAISGANARDLASLVMQGRRAISIPASAALTFDGLLRPGDRVDVLLTVKDPNTKIPTTYPLFQNLIVLAIGRTMGSASGRSKVSSGGISTVTLNVNISDGLVITNAMQMGKLTILLRNVDDIEIKTIARPTPKPAPTKER